MNNYEPPGINQKEFKTMNHMTLTKNTLLLAILAAASGAQAAPLLTNDLNAQTLYSGSYTTLGAGAIVGGNVQSVTATTVGANAQVGVNIVSGAGVTIGGAAVIGGDVTARNAGTIGADATVGGNFTTGDHAVLGAMTIGNPNIMVGGNVTAGSYVSIGAESDVTGNVTSGSAQYVATGANTTVGGNATAGTELRVGGAPGNATIGGNATAGSGNVVVGVNGVVGGNLTAGGSFVDGGSTVIGGTISETNPTVTPQHVAGPVDNQATQLAGVQTQLAGAVADFEFATTTMTVDTTLVAGVYHGTALTTTAGITITFDGNNEDSIWLINLDAALVFGANLTMELLNVTDNSSIIFNTGAALTIGAGTSAALTTNLIGTIFAESYVVAGAFVELQGIGGACGGIFSTNSYVTLGADSTIGALGCTPGAATNVDIDIDGNPMVSPSAVPVPAAAWLFGSALIGLAGVARRKK
jgi:MSHA biogenesis protein MshQ